MTALTAPPFVINRYAEGTVTAPSEAQFVQQMKLKADNGQLTMADFNKSRDLFPSNMRLLQSIKATVRQGAPFNYRASTIADPAPPPGTQAPTTTTPTPVPLWQQMNDKFTAGTLTMADSQAAQQAGDPALATAINKAIAGLGWTYTPPVAPPGPAIPTTPEMSPQVVWYDKDIWTANPTLKYLNNQGWTQNMFMTPTSKASFDPATGTTIQAAGSMNAVTMQDINNDPVRRAAMQSLYNRHNRSWEKELTDSINNAPMGPANAYTRTY